MHRAFTSESRSPEMTVTVSARQGVKIALVLLWDSLWAMVHRTNVSFTAGHDTK